jgi:hypothetical protein
MKIEDRRNSLGNTVLALNKNDCFEIVGQRGRVYVRGEYYGGNDNIDCMRINDWELVGVAPKTIVTPVRVRLIIEEDDRD